MKSNKEEEKSKDLFEDLDNIDKKDEKEQPFKKKVKELRKLFENIKNEIK